MKNIALIFLVSLLSSALSVFLYRYFEKPTIIYREAPSAMYTNFNDPASEMLSGKLQRTFLSSSPTDFISAAEAVTPAVVNIKASQNNDFDFWGGTYGGSSGSGVIISEDGYIVTNNHVIEEGKRLEVTLNDHRQYPAKLIGTDPSTDLALLKIDAKGLPNLMFGNSDKIRIGEWVLAVGNPFNLESTVTAGIVSAKGRSIDILDDIYKVESFIQTDAAVNPGNSGGALVNTNGELVGINTAIITRSGRYEGYSFAIPSNLARKVIRDLKDFGVVQRAILGISIDKVTDERAKKLNLESVEGIYVSKVSENSGAQEAGLRKGDVIVKINGAKTSSMPVLQEQIARFRPGNTVKVDYFRNGKRYQTEVTLKNMNGTTALVSSALDNALLEEIGFEIRNLTEEEIKRLGTKGAKVVSIYRGSKIERTNMDPDFIITRINQKSIRTAEDVANILTEAKGKIMLEGIYEGYPDVWYYEFPK